MAVHFSTTFAFDDEGRSAAASAAHDVVVVKLNFHHDDGELSYGEADDVEDEVAVANDDNIALCS